MQQKPTLSLCLIFKNEREYLTQAIESVADIIDEAILVDSGSDDGSENLVKEFQARWGHQKIKGFVRAWPNDFSDQKNFALDQATSDWILFLDADEKVEQEDHAKILEAIANPNADAYELPILNYTREFQELGFIPLAEKNYGYVTTKLHRLFRRKKEYRYAGILHERIEPALERSNASTYSLDAKIHHFGKLKEKDLGLEQSRYEFYAALGKKKVEANPTDSQAHWELGVVYQKQKKLAEAESEFKIALTIAPQVEEYEVYYLLSLAQQSKWEDILAKQTHHQKSNFFQALAKAQSDSAAIESLDEFRNSFSQASLLILELTLKHNRADRLEKDRARAMELFGTSGLPELIEGTTERMRSNFQAAISLLEQAHKKGSKPALHELLLSLAQAKETKRALALFDSLNPAQKTSLQPETKIILDYIRATTSLSTNV